MLTVEWAPDLVDVLGGGGLGLVWGWLVGGGASAGRLGRPGGPLVLAGTTCLVGLGVWLLGELAPLLAFVGGVAVGGLCWLGWWRC